MEYVCDLPGWVPVTKLYQHGDRHIAISVIDYYTATGTEVFLCDASGVAVDADGDPTNGLTPLLRLPAGTDFAAACVAAEEYLGGLVS